MSSSSQTSAGSSSPFVELSRADWAALAPETSPPLSEDVLESVRGLGDRLDASEVLEVYQPLSSTSSLSSGLVSGARPAQSARESSTKGLDEPALVWEEELTHPLCQTGEQPAVA